MAELKLELSGMTCNACEHIIQKVAERNGARVKSIDAQAGQVTLEAEEGKFNLLTQALADKGFAQKSGQERGKLEHFLAFAGKILAADSSVLVEARLVNYAAGALLALLAVTGIGYFFFSSVRPGLSPYLPFLALSAVASVASVFSYYNAKCYSRGIPCTHGMMFGMTLGMVPGFMAGAILGATNGMFFGSLAGMAVGMFLGVRAGKACGIMGAMEGMMAGFMAGIMGAMTSLMMLNDHLLEFLLFSFLVSLALLAGMSYMAFREIREFTAPRQPVGFARFLGASLLALAIAILFIAFGPKGPIAFL